MYVELQNGAPAGCYYFLHCIYYLAANRGQAFYDRYEACHFVEKNSRHNTLSAAAHFSVPTLAGNGTCFASGRLIMEICFCEF
jgi:hypothetical protein